MPLFSLPNLIFRAHPDIAAMMRPMIERIVADTDDGIVYRTVVRQSQNCVRPVVERVVGRHNSLRVEGPHIDVGDYGFPMGGVVTCEAGWRQLDPIETNDLLFDLRSEIDATINRWLFAKRNDAAIVTKPPEIDRSIDDPKAIALIADWVNRNRWAESCAYVK
jgi:hypothetical protein